MLRPRLIKTSYDRTILYTALALALLGLVMVTSASLAISERQFDQPFYYLIRQGVFLFLGGVVCYWTSRTPIDFWFKRSTALLLFSMALLVIVLIPGIGREVNGSRRWLSLFVITLQVSEVLKLFVVVYLASYLARYQEAVRETFLGFFKPMCLLMVISFFLLLEPDFGATVVVMTTCLGMLFLAGVKLRHFIWMLGLVLGAMAGLAISSPYRWKRLTAFLDPWQDQFASGYQLTQALIAFGRGEWFGVGLGSSVQKLFYLPEAHTDFLFAVIGEELGLVGLWGIVLLFGLLVLRGMAIGRKACLKGQYFAGFLAYGISIWFGIQAVINMGVNTGLLPTKGLTLPLMSYGGSSLLISLAAIGILLRVNSESEQGAQPRRQTSI